MQFLCNSTHGLCHLGPAEEGDLDIRDSIFSFHRPRNIDQCTTAYDHIQFCPVCMGYLFKGGIACDPGQYSYSGSVKHRLDKPQIACNVVFTDKVDIEISDMVRLPGAYYGIEQHFTCNPVPQVLGSHKAGSIDRDDPDPEFVFRPFACRLDIFTNEPAYACSIDKRGFRPDCFAGFHNGVVQLFPGTVHYIDLVHVGGESHFMKFSLCGQCAPSFPCITTACNRAMDNMCCVCYGLEHNHSSVKGA